MSDARIIEIFGETAGIAVADEKGVTFYAAARRFYPIDGAHFQSCKDAERAVKDTARYRLSTTENSYAARSRQNISAAGDTRSRTRSATSRIDAALQCDAAQLQPSFAPVS